MCEVLLAPTVLLAIAMLTLLCMYPVYAFLYVVVARGAPHLGGCVVVVVFAGLPHTAATTRSGGPPVAAYAFVARGLAFIQSRRHTNPFLQVAATTAS
jgi:ABC-type dipeptide/oligopeptide/nickel transport system permease subunit